MNNDPIHPRGAWGTDGVWGAFSDVPNSVYHATDGVSASYLKRLAVSPAHAKLPVEFSAVAQRGIDIGTLVHGFVLEGAKPEDMGFEQMPEKFDLSGYAQKPEGMSFAKTDGKAWKAEQEAAGRIIVTRDPLAVAQDAWLNDVLARKGKVLDHGMLTTARAVESAIFAEPEARRITSRRGRSELSLRAHDADFGLILKARFDYADPADEDGMIWDIKTTARGVDPEAFGFECEDRGYLLQAAHYLHVAELLGIKFAGFRFVAASTVAPYEVGVYDFGPTHPAWGAVNEHLLELYALHKTCAEVGDWPKRAWGPLDIAVPYRSRYGARKEGV